MNKIKLDCSLNDTENLRNIILKNPNLPLLIFCSEDCNSGDYGYEQAYVKSVEIQELTLYNSKWINEDDLENELKEYCDFTDVSDNDYDEIIKKRLEQAKFVRAIVIYVDN